MTQIDERNELIKKKGVNPTINCYAVGPSFGNFDWIPVENADDYPPKHGTGPIFLPLADIGPPLHKSGPSTSVVPVVPVL